MSCELCSHFYGQSVICVVQASTGDSSSALSSEEDNKMEEEEEKEEEKAVKEQDRGGEGAKVTGGRELCRDHRHVHQFGL